MNKVFRYTLQDTELYEDPLKIRRILLENTDGRCWAYMHDLAVFKRQLVELGILDQELETTKAAIAINQLNSCKLEGILAEAAIEAFNFQSLNVETGEGVTEIEALEILGRYMEYAEGKE